MQFERHFCISEILNYLWPCRWHRFGSARAKVSSRRKFGRKQQFGGLEVMNLDRLRPRVISEEV